MYRQASKTDAERARRYRARRRQGLCVVPLEVSESEIDGLVRGGLLESSHAGDPKKVGEAVREAMKEHLEKFRHACHPPGQK